MRDRSGVPTQAGAIDPAPPTAATRFAWLLLAALPIVWLGLFDPMALGPAGHLLHDLTHESRHAIGLPCHE